MDKRMLIIEMPELDDEAAVGFQHFLQYLTNAVETHYFSQIRRYYQKLYYEESE